jgi:hypothetical protein
VDLDWQARRNALVRTYIEQRGWALNCRPVQGDVVRDRAYSKDGYGVIRGKIGAWP